jgi:hypothetical protein
MISFQQFSAALATIEPNFPPFFRATYGSSIALCKNEVIYFAHHRLRPDYLTQFVFDLSARHTERIRPTSPIRALASCLDR